MQNPAKNFFLVLIFGLLSACQNINSPTPTIEKPQAALESANEAESSVSESSALTSSDLSLQSRGSIIPEAISHDDLWARIRDGFQLNEYYSRKIVGDQIAVYAEQQRYFDLMHDRAAPFLYWIVEEIDKRKLPQEFALLPMVESTFNPNAYSREHAVGLWQFLGATGQSFGLQQDWWFDGRRDPRASTIAALDYMEELYQQFNQDWLLAIAAYNTGDGNMRRAIRRSGHEKDEVDFWTLNLPSETEAHIPKLLALAAIISDNEKWGIQLQPLANKAVLRSVNVGTQIDISQAASLAKIDYQLLRALNPGYLQWATHPEQPQEILLPFANAEIFEAALVGLDETMLLTWDRYEIRPGDTLGAIARRLNTRVDVLQSFNSLPDSRIVAGESLLIPRTNDAALLAAAPRIDRNPEQPQQKIPKQYTVRKGDNLWRIGRRFNLKSIEIASWNQIPLDQILQPGLILDLQYARQDKDDTPKVLLTDNPAVYIIRRGDTMDRIASRFNIELHNLLQWNKLNIGELIFPGQILQIAAQEASLN